MPTSRPPPSATGWSCGIASCSPRAYSDHADALAKAGSPEWQEWADKAAATYDAVIADPGFAALDRDPGNLYHQRLVFNGLMVALHQGARKLQGTEPLAGAKVLPTDPSYDREKAVDLAYAALAYAAQREAALADARRRGLIEATSAQLERRPPAPTTSGATPSPRSARPRVSSMAQWCRQRL